MTQLPQRDVLLDRITEARKNLREADESFAERMKLARIAEQQNLTDLLDVAIRQAYNSGLSIAAIQRAYPTRAFSTIKQSLERTEHLPVFTPNVIEPFVSGYTFYLDKTIDPMVITVSDNWESVDFEIYYLDDGKLMLSLQTIITEDENYGAEIISQLDGMLSGDLYYKVEKWILEHGGLA